jgi:hypothetical protein
LSEGLSWTFLSRFSSNNISTLHSPFEPVSRALCKRIELAVGLDVSEDPRIFRMQRRLGSREPPLASFNEP